MCIRDRSGIVYIGAEVKPNDILAGKVTPKGDTPTGPEEKLLRSIFGEKAIDVIDTSLRLPLGSEGVVVDVKVFNRHGVEKDERSIAIERNEIEMIQEDKVVEEEILERNTIQRATQIIKNSAINEKFEEYSPNEKIDTKILRGAGVDLLFVPSADEIYPKGFSTSITVSSLTNELCGARRPGHFSGVATVVAKLLLQILPDAAIFGEKDYQQLMVIRQMVRDLDIRSEIVGVATKRDKDGLALSSRNRYLTVNERKMAPKLFHVLCAVAEVAKKTPADLINICENAKEDLAKVGFSSVEYLSVCDSKTLKPLEVLVPHARVFSAVHLGKARLIVNVPICF